MDILNTYFESLDFYYIKTLSDNYQLYGAAVHTLLDADIQRCILAFVPVTAFTPKVSKLKDLPWVNLQARECSTEDYNLVPQNWRTPKNLPNLLFRVFETDKTGKSYKCINHKLPLRIKVLYGKDIDGHRTTVNLHWAVDQYNTIFNIEI